MPSSNFTSSFDSLLVSDKYGGGVIDRVRIFITNDALAGIRG